MKHLYLFIIFLGLSISLQAQSFSGGNGTSSQPWQISTAEQLDYFVRSYSGNAGKNRYFVITKNISMESHISSHYGGNGWIPYIGISSFYGHLNGGGYTISGIWKNDTNHMAGGLFSILETGGRIYDLGIELGKSGIRSKHFTGGLLAVNRGTVSTCFVKGADVHSGNSSIGVGGLVGMNDPGGIISRSYTDCKVNGDSFIKHPATPIPAMGGFVGLNKGRIEECYSKGKVSGLYGGGSFAGVNQSGTMSRCYFDIDSCGMPKGVGRDLSPSPETIYAIHTPLMKQQSTFINWNFDDTWIIAPICSYPLFRWEGIPPGCEYIFLGKGTEENPYQLWTAKDIDNLRLYTGNTGKNIYFKLMADIDLSDYIQEYYPNNGWEPIGEKINWSNYPENSIFHGLLDGNVHTLSGLYIGGDKGDYVGLFRTLGDGGWIKNLGLVDYCINSIHYSQGVGAIVGENKGSIVNCFTIGTVAGERYVGGICGVNNGTIKYCRSYHGDGSSDQYSKTYQMAGGIAGLNYGNVISCHASGTIYSDVFGGGIVGYNDDIGSVRFCSSMMSLTIYSYAGGLAYSNYGEMEYCYHIGPIVGKSIKGLAFVDGGRMFFNYSVYESRLPWDSSTSNHFVLSSEHGIDSYYYPSSLDGYNYLKKHDTENYWRSQSRDPRLILGWQEQFDNCYRSWSPFRKWKVDPYTMDRCIYSNGESYYFQVYLSPLEYWPGRYCNPRYFATKNRPATLSKEKADTLSPISPLPPVTIIYPNPTTGKVTIESSEENLMVKVYNLQGILLKETTEKEVDLSPYPAGTYLFHINGKVQKVIKK